MTRRERKEARLEQRQDWAESRDRKAAASFDTAQRIGDGIPFGQPILVGHHSEKRARKDQERIYNGMMAGIDSEKMAAHHREVAGGIADQLDRSIFSDDDDAIEALEQRVAGLEDERQHMKDINKAIKAFQKRTGKANKDLTSADLAECGCTVEDVKKFWPDLYGWRFPPYALQSLGGNIKRNRDRIVSLRRQAAVADEASATTNGVLILGDEFVNVVFAEKPDREILDELKAAGFSWGGGKWMGYRERLPASVLALA